MMFPKDRPWRSPRHRRLVASLACAACGIEGYGQCAHSNAGKGMSLKSSDILTFSLCCDRPGVRGCHSRHDQGGAMTRDERTQKEWEYCDQKRAAFIRKGWWGAEEEVQYQAAIVPLARVVHGDAA